MFPKKYIDITI